ncbi:ribosomal maturation YjgA family protein [Piscinibacter terrae]|uniref:DUF2809 domain-containing protein n=1 Tax=Piscinibacter terrae TaxID=2496871 RepID=A0A3N7HRH6_9BURK|nr:DUF2809 domain-containing protein [Albitalea terrae]RQP24850.1 DUF2809 domain-containing protein [Albitalea terrae]
MRARRSRVVMLTAMALIVALGLASRKLPGLFPVALGKYPGDALWALMVFCIAGAVRPAASTARLAAVALGISFAVEFSQLYHAPWIDGIRSTTLGHLVLGSAFGWIDLAAYTVGVVIGAAVDALWRKARQP